MTGSPAQTTVCGECGRIWTCDPAGDCWCKALPPVLPASGERCLCPCKLQALVDERRGTGAPRGT